MPVLGADCDLDAEQADKNLSSASSAPLHTKCLLSVFLGSSNFSGIVKKPVGVGFRRKVFLRCYRFKDLFVALFYDTPEASVLKLGDKKLVIRSGPDFTVAWKSSSS